MNAGIPLTDEDRWPWLQDIHDFVASTISTNNIIMVCSALKQVYRERLCKDLEDKCKWIFLNGDYDTILQRLQKRAAHYMPPSLLRSQFEALEIPTDAIIVDIRQSPEIILDRILANLD